MTTLVLGASTNPTRYSYTAIKRLRAAGHRVIAVGARDGQIDDLNILTEIPIEKVHTVTMYLSPPRQIQYHQALLTLKPRRIIMNPGTENDEIFSIAERMDAEVIEACTLVMLSIGIYDVAEK